MASENIKAKYPFTKVNPSRTVPTGIPGGTPTGRRSDPAKGKSAQQKADFQRENEVADLFAAAGYQVEQNPAPPTERPVKKTMSGLPNPDYKIEGRYIDLYTPKAHTGMNTIMGQLKDKAKRQAARVVLDLSQSQFAVQHVKDLMAAGRYKPSFEYLEELIVIDNNNHIHHIYP